jgi:hypothetical protein
VEHGRFVSLYGSIRLNCYPNPLNLFATVQFGLPESGPVRLTVYNLLGRSVLTLVDGNLGAGWHVATLDAANLAAVWPCIQPKDHLGQVVSDLFSRMSSDEMESCLHNLFLR